MNNTQTSTQNFFFLNAALETAAANNDHEATAEHFANIATSLTNNLARRILAGQDIQEAAQGSIAEHLEAMDATGDDIRRCLLQDILQHAIATAA